MADTDNQSVENTALDVCLGRIILARQDLSALRVSLPPGLHPELTNLMTALRQIASRTEQFRQHLTTK